MSFVLLLLGFGLGAQIRSVTGHVTQSADGTPLPGVNIFVKGSDRGTQTDFDGRYQIQVRKGEVLIFRFIGMTQLSVTVGRSKTIDVAMKAAAKRMREVVVTGYQNMDKHLFTGASSHLKAKDVVQPGLPEVARMLEGKVSGVSLQNVSGTFGTGPKITIRGASSIYGENRPLWVVDGVVLEDILPITADQLSSGDANTVIASSIAGLNADDIASVEVLKDASATALYGARAMNGVVVVTTKKGRSGRLSVHYTGSFSTRFRPTYTHYDIMNSQDQISVLRDMERKGLLNYTKVVRARNSGIYGLYYKGLSKLQDGSFEADNTPEAEAAFLQRYELINTDWFKVLFRDSQTQTHTLSLSGGGEKSRIYASTSYYHDPGWSVADQVDRLTANLNAAFDLSPHLEFDLQTYNSLRKQKLPGTLDRTTDAVDGQFKRDFDINPFSYALNTSRASSPYDDQGHYEYYTMNWAPFNILEELQNNRIELNVLDAKLQLGLHYKLRDFLKYHLLGSLRYVKSDHHHIITEHANAANAYRAMDDDVIRKDNVYLFTDPNFPNRLPTTVLPYGGFYNLTVDRMESYYVRNTLDFSQKSEDGNHVFKAFAGQELRYIDRDHFFHEGPGIQYDKGNQVFADPDFYRFRAQSAVEPFQLDYGKERFLAFFSNFGYAYRDTYILHLTGRYDGSNKLGKSLTARWLPTWNVSGAWDVLREPFVKKLETPLSHLKLRATYGLTANMGIAKNALAIYRSQITVRRFKDNKENQISISALENSQLTWEKQYELNLGIDVGLWKERLSLTTDLYWRKGFDLIDYVRTSGIGGERTKLANNANMKTRGVECALHTLNVKGRDFNWNTDLTFSWYHQEITRLQHKPEIIDLIMNEGGTALGHEQRSLYSIPFVKLDKEGIPIFKNEKGGESRDIDFQSRHTDFLKYEGPVAPNMNMGLTNRVRYKNFEFSFFLSYQGGNKIRLAPIYAAHSSDLIAFSKELKDRWMVPGDENRTHIPTIPSKMQLKFDEHNTLTKAYNAYDYSDQRVADGSFLRLKTVGLTYHFDRTLVQSIGLGGLSLELQAVNPWLVYSDPKLHGQDPEFFRAGGVAYPVSKQLTLSLKVQF